MSDPVRLPKASDRVAIVGRTGSGKTVAAVWHLSKQDINRRPWFVLDYKGDDLINDIDKAQHIPITTDPRSIKKPGIYVVKLMPGDAEAARLEAFLWRLWERENCGLYVDEGYMIDRYSDAFNAMLTQGRSKRLSMIVLSQRPVLMSRFVFSEASFFQVFDLTHDKDKDKVMEFIKGDTSKELPDYHSYYYDVARKQLNVFGPVPDGDSILADIDAKLPRHRPVL